ncbi:lipopolysaccharide transport system ATP-binding protein [Ectothiorhodospira magna]|uniref:Lipopolysaccharide transport system ATP-binding protein n=1 Tax=Ectothiorhodospira magna TaxID=867345 RepID=A0A1H9BJA2_9GAMM|nr:ABC transporter ATP-binding protein [Ectothiorhodospira magna]SEP89056.1 lipopolysaccharide transport system ATP-binding protein [Ectothiorhodospira magna]
MSCEIPSGTAHALTLRQVSKTYALYDRPLDRVLELLTRRPRHRAFTALHPLSLEIPQGMSLGIVGDNGAGKSTLMHLMAGSHQPTTGTLTRQGQVLGLLELGVGFHPEFTGRENIFFHGDMLGLPRAYVRDRYEDILAFAELGQFIDQPLRTYSTGMRVRLAFALVASLDPDILIVDEALSVGDMHFQKKCIDRMGAFRQAGKTIVLCSHSLYQVESFCDQVLWMREGRVEMFGPPAQVLPAYERYQLARSAPMPTGDVQAPPRHLARLVDFSLDSSTPLHIGDDLMASWRVEAVDPQVLHHYTLSLKLESGRGLHVAGSRLRGQPPRQGSGRESACFGNIPLASGFFTLHLRLWDDTGLVLLDERVIDGIEVRKTDDELGVLRLPFSSQWQPKDTSAP